MSALEVLPNQELDINSYLSLASGQADVLVREDRVDNNIHDMMDLLSVNDTNLEIIQSQNWFSRAWNTVAGKNKALKTVNEQNLLKVQKLSLAIVKELENRNQLSRDAILQVNQKYNELAESQQELKQFLLVVTERISERFESNEGHIEFQYICEEIKLGHHSQEKPIIGLHKVLLDLLKLPNIDDRQNRILTTLLSNNGMASDNNKSVSEFMVELSETDEVLASNMLLKLNSLYEESDHPVAMCLFKSIEYAALPESKRRFIKFNKVLKDSSEDFSIEAEISLNCIYEEVIFPLFIADINSRKDPVEENKQVSLSPETNIKTPENDLMQASPVNVNDINEQYKKAESLYDDEKYDEAFSIVQKLANLDHAKSTALISICYLKGTGVKQEFEKARYWANQAPEEQNSLVTFYMLTFIERNKGWTSNCFNLVKRLFELANDVDKKIYLKDLLIWEIISKSSIEKLKAIFNEVNGIKNITPSEKDDAISCLVNKYAEITADNSYIYEADKVPKDKLMNAKKTFLKSLKDEKLLLFYDSTIFGSAEEGFALTNRKIYFKEISNRKSECSFTDERIKSATKYVKDGHIMFESSTPAGFMVTTANTGIHSGMGFAILLEFVSWIYNLPVKEGVETKLSSVKDSIEREVKEQARIICNYFTNGYSSFTLSCGSKLLFLNHEHSQNSFAIRIVKNGKESVFHDVHSFVKRCPEEASQLAEKCMVS